VKEVGASARARKAGRQRKRTCFAIGCEAASGTAARLGTQVNGLIGVILC
jgi:hypothetical protein